MAREVKFRQELVDNDIILSVRHLKQFFKFGHGRGALKTKAVHDVSFDVKKGECFGLVGESGCGKTTTGRSLIRLYNITSGSVYFKGYRISAGKRWNEKEIKWKRIKMKNAIKDLRQAEELEILEVGSCDKIREIDAKISEIKQELVAAKQTYKDSIKRVSNADDENELDMLKEEALKAYNKSVDDINAKIDALNAKRHEVETQIDEIKNKYQQKIDEKRAEFAKIYAEQKEAIKQINYDNKHVDKKIMSKMQMIFQDPVDSLDPRMTVEDIIQEGLHIQGQYNSYANRKQVKEVLEKVGLLPEYASRYPHEFSGGQRQRIGIARALIMQPEFLICDEPISALDVSIRAQIINLLNDLKEEMGLTILFIAHDLSVVKYFCDRIAVMYYGEIVELADSDELFKHPLHPYTHALLSAIPKPDPISEKVRKRYVYIPSKEHDYSTEAPKLTEITPGHFVLANSVEIEKYKKELEQSSK